MYSPTLARFTSLDPLPPDGEAVLMRKSLYEYANNNPVNFVDPSGTTPVPCKAPGCTGGCIVGRNVKLKSISITKAEPQKGSHPACDGITKTAMEGKLKEIIEYTNSLYDEKIGWARSFCSADCNCGNYTIPDKMKDIDLADQIIERTEKVRALGDVNCTFKVSGKITLTGGSLTLIACVPVKK